jgi:hypothetical protein
MPACLKDANVTFTNDAATIGWDEPALTHAAKDENLTEYGVHDTDQECQDCSSEEESVHAPRPKRCTCIRAA